MGGVENQSTTIRFDYPGRTTGLAAADAGRLFRALCTVATACRPKQIARWICFPRLDAGGLVDLSSSESNHATWQDTCTILAVSPVTRCHGVRRCTGLPLELPDSSQSSRRHTCPVRGELTARLTHLSRLSCQSSERARRPRRAARKTDSRHRLCSMLLEFQTVREELAHHSSCEYPASRCDSSGHH